MDIEDIPGILAVYREPETVPPVLPDGTETGVEGAPEDELTVLLRRLDAWTPRDNPGPLIRWAAAVIRGADRA